MKFKRFSCTSFGLLALGGVVWGCSGQASDCTANENCGPFDAGSGSGGTGAAGSGGNSAGGSNGKSGAGGASNAGESGASSAGEAGTAGAPDAGCDSSAGPDVASCVIGDGYGLFVSTTGDDTVGDGTEAKPFASVTKALSVTGPGKVNRLYVCADEYDEPATLVIPDRVSIYGGFTCDSGVWAYDASGQTKAQLKPASPVGAMIDTATHGITLQDIRIDAQDAPEDGTGASSFGMTINASTSVALYRVEIHAGKGGGGKAGTDGATGADGTGAGTSQNGKKTACDGTLTLLGGSWSMQSACNVLGGTGGSGKVSQPAGAGDSGQPASDVEMPNLQNGGAGATTVGAGAGGIGGQQGSTGLAGARGAASPDVGLFTGTGYTLASGGDGTSGHPGQGGGGGGASKGDAVMCSGSSGGAGGMGGCGGAFGSGGFGGGASVALLSWGSAVSINACNLIAGTGGAAGRGGNAGSGGIGKIGGTGGDADTTNGIGKGGAGGDGGNGGNGGNGAGGTGGPSIALVYSGTRPDDSMSPATLSKSTGGALGAGGKVGGTSTLLPGPDGQVGMAATEYNAN